ncbi:MAG: hypothetical protein IIC90_11720, partial [Chloroflexi bacterium]|nr:hypothetical protein [Chloroflexota bacterium]
AQAEQHQAAAEAAEAATEWQQAVDEYEACLSLLIQTPAAGGLEEAALLTALGRCYWNLSEARTAWRTLRRAISISQERADGVAQAKATVEILHIWGPPDRHRMMAEDSLEALGDGDPYLRARLLLELGWQDEPSADADDRYAEALALAEEHGFEDILTSRVQRQAWSLMEDGQLDEAIRLFENAHETYARLHVHHVAAGVLRGAGFNLLEAGRLDQGYEFAQRSFEYAAGVNLVFGAQLALMDMIGVTFARDEFERCEELLASSPGDSDFRGDLYRMWMAEARGDMDGALRLMVDPDRGGKTPTAVGQIHAAAAGLLFRAGKEDAAQAALRAWAAVERPGGDEPYWIEAAPVTDCLVALGDEELVRRVHQAFLAQEDRVGSPARFSTLQGRALAPVRAAVCLRLGLLDDAERHYREGLAWCEQERLPRDAELCRAGLADVAAQR